MSEQPEAPRRRRRTPSAPPPPQGSVIKGGILVALAVIIGFVLLRDDPVSVNTSIGTDRGDQVDDTGTDDGTDPDGNQGGDDNGTDDGTPELPEARDPADVKVLVANGSGVTGAAGSFTETVIAQGYVTGNPTNTDSSDVVAESRVYFTEGYEAEAHAVASVIGASGGAVAPLPTPAPVANTELSHIIVVLGVDLAEG